MKPILKSTKPKFILRKLSVKDAQGWLDIQNDKEARRNFNSVPETLSEAKKELKEKLENIKKKKAEFLAIEIDRKFVGFVGIHSLDKKSLNRKESVGVIGAGLHKNFRGKGIVTSVVKLFIPYCFKKFKLGKISGRCREFNRASVRLMEKCGFVFEKRGKKEALKDGKYYDNLYFGRVR